MPQKIQVQYDDMENIAQVLGSLGDDTQTTIQSIENAMSQLEGGGWKGVGAEKFYDEMHSEVLPRMKLLQAGFETGQQQVKQAIGKFQEAEQTILSYFASL